MPRRSVMPSPQKNKKSKGGNSPHLPKVVVVTGGVISGLGKGIACASIGNILKRRGFHVNVQKFDPYLNSDAGTLNPTEHGEVFVTADGGETDLDLGHYERFLNEELTKQSSVMAGNIYMQVVNNERKGSYLGKTVQVIPHVTNAIKENLYKAALAGKNKYDIHIAEIGGTVGDYEGVVFHEAMRQLLMDRGRENVLYVHLVFLPFLSASGEVKTKPAQNSVKDLRNIGIQPDVLIVRSDHAIPKKLIAKLSQFTNVAEAAIIPLPTIPYVYEVPLVMEDYGLDKQILEQFKLTPRKKKDGSWKKTVTNMKRAKPFIKIAIVGKYMEMNDTYMSLVEALRAACWTNGRDLDLWWIDAERIEKGRISLKEIGKKARGIVVPGGFGKRGTEGKIQAIKYARENDIPYLGLCLGMQLAVVEFARNVLGIKNATSEEFNSSAPEQVIHIMEEQKKVNQKGGTMRLGAWPCVLTEDTKVRKIYGKKKIQERHRHRYEFNNKYCEEMKKHGLTLSGLSPNKKLVEIIELSKHRFFVGVQFHPEFQSRPDNPHPLFSAFIAAAKNRNKKRSKA